MSPTWRARGLSKSFISLSRVIIGVTPFRVLITLLITYLLSPPPLQVVKPKSPVETLTFSGVPGFQTPQALNPNLLHHGLTKGVTKSHDPLLS